MSIPGTSALAHSNSCPRPSHSTCVLDSEDPDCSRLVVDGSSADLMVGAKESFVKVRADVTTVQPVHDSLAVPLALDQVGEPQL